jgi:hypothetical protein
MNIAHELASKLCLLAACPDLIVREQVIGRIAQK